MLVILKETTRKLGAVGDVVKVKRGFARNFLIPQKKAVQATKANLEALKSQEKQIKKQQSYEIENAKKIASAINAIDVLPIFARVESGRLFGSVGAKQIISALQERSITLHTKNVVLSSAIKESGEHTVKVFLHSDVVCSLKIYVLDISKKPQAQS